MTVADGVVTGIDLDANYTLDGSYGPYPASGTGTFTVDGDAFTVLATANIETSGAIPDIDVLDPAMEWNWTGTIVPEPSSLFMLFGALPLAFVRRRGA